MFLGLVGFSALMLAVGIFIGFLIWGKQNR
jgi:hypothetical protein